MSMEILDLILEQALVMVPVLIILGKIIKQGGWVNNKHIPVILLAISLGFTPYLLGSYTNPENFVQAILVAGGAVFGNQLYKQYKEG